MFHISIIKKRGISECTVLHCFEVYNVVTVVELAACPNRLTSKGPHRIFFFPPKKP